MKSYLPNDFLFCRVILDKNCRIKKSKGERDDTVNNDSLLYRGEIKRTAKLALGFETNCAHRRTITWDADTRQSANVFRSIFSFSRCARRSQRNKGKRSEGCCLITSSCRLFLYKISRNRMYARRYLLALPTNKPRYFMNALSLAKPYRDVPLASKSQTTRKETACKI